MATPASTSDTLIVKIEIDQAVVNTSKQRAAELTSEIIDLKKQQDKLKVATAGNVSAQKASAGTMVALQAKIAAVTKEQRQHTEILKQAHIATVAQDGSNNKLRAQLSLLTNQYNALSKSERTGTQTGKDLETTIRSLSDQLKENEKAVGDNRRNVGNYGEALKDLRNDLKAAKAEMVEAAAKFGMGSSQFNDAAAKAGDLADRMKDVNEATKTFATGSNFEKLGNSFNGIASDIKNLDFEGASEKAQQFADIAGKMTFKEMTGGLKNLGTTLANVGKSLLLNPIFLIGAAVAAAAVAFKAWVDSTEEATAAQKKLNDEFEKAQFQTRKLDIEYRKITGTITEFQASVEQLEVEHAEALKGIADDTEKNLKETIGWWDKVVIALTKMPTDKILSAVREQNQKTKLETIKYTKELQNLYAEDIKNSLDRIKEATESEAAIRQEIADKKKEQAEKEIEDAKEKAAKIAEIETQRLNDLKDLYQQAEQERFDLRNIFYQEQLAASQTQSENEKDQLRERVKELRFAGAEEIEIEKFIASETKRIRIEGKERELTASEDLINKSAAHQKNILTATIDDEKQRKSAIRKLEIERLESVKQLYDEMYNTATASMDGIVTFDKETSDLMRERAAKASAELVELKRQESAEIVAIKKEETKQKEDEEKAFKDAAIQSAQEIVGAVSAISSANRDADFDAAMSKLDQQRSAELNSANLTESQKAAINKKYDKLAAAEKKKAFEKEKQAKIIEATIATALAVVKALPNYINAALAGIAGAAQIAVISSQPTPEFASGGYISGPGTGTSDSIPIRVSDGESINTAKATEMFGPILSALNAAGGGVDWYKGYNSGGLVNAFAGGGVAVATNQAFQQIAQTDQLAQSFTQTKIVAIIQDIQAANEQTVRVAQNLEV